MDATSNRPVCPVCHQPVILEVVHFVNRMVERQVYQCGAAEQLLPERRWLAACPAAMSEYLAAEREIARLQHALRIAEKVS